MCKPYGNDRSTNLYPSDPVEKEDRSPSVKVIPLKVGEYTSYERTIFETLLFYVFRSNTILYTEMIRSKNL